MRMLIVVFSTWANIIVGRLRYLASSRRVIAEFRRCMHVTEEIDEVEWKMFKTWQSKWERSDKERLTFSLIFYVERWYERKHDLVDFYLTQALFGYSFFMAYLKWIGKRVLVLWLSYRRRGTHVIWMLRMVGKAEKVQNDERRRDKKDEFKEDQG